MCMTLQAIKDRCRIDGECWIWHGPLIRNRPYMSVHEGGVRFNRRVQKVVLELSGSQVRRHGSISQSCSNKHCCCPYHQIASVDQSLLTSMAGMRGNPWALLWMAC